MTVPVGRYFWLISFTGLRCLQSDRHLIFSEIAVFKGNPTLTLCPEPGLNG